MFNYKVRLPDNYWHSAVVRLLVKYYCDGIIVNSNDKMLLYTASYLHDNIYTDIDFTVVDNRRRFGFLNSLFGVEVKVPQWLYRRRISKETTPYILIDLQKDVEYFKTIKETSELFDKPIYVTICEKYNTINAFSKLFLELIRL